MTPSEARTRGARVLSRWLLPGCIYAGLILSLQRAGGAYQAGFDGSSDEPAHYVTGLMVRDYVAHGFPAPPMQYARNYYLHYPEVAFGHWPPVFYGLQAVWTLLLPVSHSSMLVFMALLAAGAALAIHRCAATRLSPTAGWLAGLLFCAAPLTQVHAAMLMTEIPLVLMCLLALIGAVRFLERDTMGRALTAGVLISLAVLTKASGWAVPLAVPLALVCVKGWWRLRCRNFWVTTAIVTALCLPYYALTLKMTRAGMEGRMITWSRASRAFTEYLADFPAKLGLPLTLLAACGLILYCVLPWRQRGVAPFWAIMGSFLAAVVVFHCVVPTWPEPRKNFVVIPVVLLFAAAGVHRIATLLPLPDRFREPAVALLALGSFLLLSWRIPHRPPSVIGSTVQQLLSHRKSVALVCSPKRGQEGALIAAVASQETERPQRYVLRGTKLLMASTWNGLNYRPRFRDAGDLRAGLAEIPVGLLVVESPNGVADHPHEVMLKTMLSTYAAEWQEIDSGAPHIRIYRRTQNLDDRPLRIELDLRDKLGVVIKMGG